jgi:hypothetical protein
MPRYPWTTAEMAMTRMLPLLPPEDSFATGAVGVITGEGFTTGAGAGVTTGSKGQHSDSAPRIHPQMKDTVSNSGAS